VPTSHVLGGTGSAAASIAYANQFCYVKAFTYTDINASMEVKKGVQAYINVGNVFGRDAPVAPGAYSSAPSGSTRRKSLTNRDRLVPCTRL